MSIGILSSISLCIIYYLLKFQNIFDTAFHASSSNGHLATKLKKTENDAYFALDDIHIWWFRIFHSNLTHSKMCIGMFF